jgi:hypothetical protein
VNELTDGTVCAVDAAAGGGNRSISEIPAHSSRQHKWIASRIFSKNSCREEKLCFQVNPHAQSMPAMVEARLSAPLVFLADEARMTFSSFF